jgi:hypothetical protein
VGRAIHISLENKSELRGQIAEVENLEAPISFRIGSYLFHLTPHL